MHSVLKIDKMMRFNIKSADRLLWLLLGVWWILNLVQGVFTELADDESYYYMFAQNLSWGYFDHPPMTALAVWLGNWMGGALGVRFFCVMMQPLYLAMLWYIIRPADAAPKDAVLFTVIAAGLPMMQLYGFIAVPDAPLLLTSALFFLCYKRFTNRDSLLNTLLLAVSIAALAYSKYHGALVVMLTIASNPRILKNPKFYLAGVAALVLYVPHLLWQYQHDWVSFRYHLVGRSNVFKLSYVTEYLLNLVAVFNPLFFPLYFRAWRNNRHTDPTLRAMKFVGLGLILFFLASSIRGYVQPQWVIIAAFGLIAVLFDYSRRHARTRKFVMIAGIVAISLIGLVRLVMIFNPIGIKFQIFDNEQSYGAIANLADGRPVIFDGSYYHASKYNFYTGQPSYGQPNVYYRSSEWQFRDDDTQFAGKSVLVNTGEQEGVDTVLMLPNGKSFGFVVVDNFMPVRKITVEHNPLPDQVRGGDSITLEVTLRNPYDYSVAITPDSVRLIAVIKRGRDGAGEVVIPINVEIPAHGQVRVATRMIVPKLEPDQYMIGFSVHQPYVRYWYADSPKRVEVLPAN